MLEVRDLTVRYGDTIAVRGVDLDVGDGEVVCILGPSGSGKSTLLHAIAGLAPIDTGVVRRDGVDLAGVPPHRREIGLMFQHHALFPHLDVMGNVMFGLRMHGTPRPDAQERAREMLDLVGLAGYESRRVRELSGGEQQRVSLARALAPAPSLLMLDEPLGALDRALREQLASELRSLFDVLDVGVLLVTHDQDEAFALGDRVAILHSGELDQIGTPVDVWRHPASERVARFLGWNITDAIEGVPTVVRPDALRVSDDGTLPGTVVDQTFRRDHFRLRVAIDGGEDVLDVVVRDGTPPPRGARVMLAVDGDGVIRLAP